MLEHAEAYPNFLVDRERYTYTNIVCVLSWLQYLCTVHMLAILLLL